MFYEKCGKIFIKIKRYSKKKGKQKITSFKFILLFILQYEIDIFILKFSCSFLFFLFTLSFANKTESKQKFLINIFITLSKENITKTI